MVRVLALPCLPKLSTGGGRLSEVDYDAPHLWLKKEYVMKRWASALLTGNR
jgi:hypothetical protein